MEAKVLRCKIRRKMGKSFEIEVDNWLRLTARCHVTATKSKIGLIYSNTTLIRQWMQKGTTSCIRSLDSFFNLDVPILVI